MSTFKFFEGIAEKQRVFTDFMDALDDYHLLGNPTPTHHMEVPAPRLKPYNLNVIDTIIFGRIPRYAIAIEPYETTLSSSLVGTISDLINGRFEIPWCFTSITIQRCTSGIVEINYDNVDEIDRFGLIFDSRDIITVKYNLN